MFRKIVVFILLAASFTLSACGQMITFNNQSMISGSGKLTTETRTASGFTRVALNGQGNVKIILGDHESLSIDAEDNLMKYITTSVQGAKLVISTSPNIQIRPTRPVTYTVTVKSLDALSLGGAGNITVEAPKSDQLSLEITGAGNINVSGLAGSRLIASIGGAGSITVKGQMTRQSVTLSGSGSFFASDLKSTSADVTISGMGNVSVWSTGTLKATISGSGNISYYDTPSLTQSITGSGKIDSLGAHS